MSLDNAAITVTDGTLEVIADPTPPVVGNAYDDMSTRDLLILLHQRFDRVESIADNVQETVAPLMERISGSPMLKMILKV